jgi:hypothetical protein
MTGTSPNFLRKTCCFITLFACLVTIAKGQGAGASAAGAGGACGGGGGSNVYSFRYVFLSHSKRVDSLELSRGRKPAFPQSSSFSRNIDTAYTIDRGSGPTELSPATFPSKHANTPWLRQIPLLVGSNNKSKKSNALSTTQRSEGK